MEFRLFYLFVKHVFGNLKIPLEISVIAPSKFLNISIAGCQVF